MWGPGLQYSPTPPSGVLLAPPQRKVCSRATCTLWVLTKYHGRGTQPDVYHHTEFQSRILTAAAQVPGRGRQGGPSDCPQQDAIPQGLPAGAHRHGGLGSRPSPSPHGAPKQTLPPMFLGEKVESFQKSTFISELHFLV